MSLLVGFATVTAAYTAALVLVRVVPDRSRTARSDAWAAGTALAMFSLFYGTFFLRSLLSGNYIAPSDSLDFGVADYLSPPGLWTGGIWSGYPIGADPQSLVWYPPLQLFRALRIDWNIFLISAYVIASTTCFLFVRRLTGSTVAGAFSGVACSFNALAIGYITNFNQLHAFAWVPLVLYGLQLIREGRLPVGAAVGAIAVALMWLAGHPQVPVYAMYLAGGFAAGSVIVDRPPLRATVRRMLCSAGALALGLAIAAVMLVPMIELSGYSPRADSSFELYSSSAVPARELLTLVAPFAFGGFWAAPAGVPYVGSTGDSGYLGLLPLALAAAAPFVVRRHRGDARVWVAIAVVEAVLSLGAATPLGTLFFYAPGFSRFQAPLRHLFLFSLSAVVAAGLAVAELIQSQRLGRVVATGVAIVTSIGLLGVVALAWGASDVGALFRTRPDAARWALAWPLLPGAAIAAVALAARVLTRGSKDVAYATVLIACATADLVMVHYRLPGRRFEYADIARTEAVLHPRMASLRAELHQSGGRVLATDGSKNPFLLPNLTRAWDVPAASGTGSLAISEYLDLLGMSTSGAVSRAALADAGTGVDLFSVRYALVRQDSELAADMQTQPTRWHRLENLHYEESDPDTFYTLFSNARALPRAWCVSRLIHVDAAGGMDAIRSGRAPDGSVFDPRVSALLESDPPAEWRDAFKGEPPRVRIERTPGGERFIVRTDHPCMLVISEVYYPWWRAALDESPGAVHRVNHAMLGILVRPGSHLVRLWMLPLSVWLGALISVSGVLLCAALVMRRDASPNSAARSSAAAADHSGHPS